VEEFYRLSVPSRFIPNGVDFGALEPGDGRPIRAMFDTPEAATIALFMGNLSRQKRPDRFLRVMKRALEQDETLYGWLLGDGPDRAQLEQAAAEMGIASRIRFLGYQEQVAPYIRAADFYVSTSDTEGIPAVVLEVGYLGRPAVGMKVGGMHECVLDGQTGVLVDEGDEQALVREILRLTRDRDTRERLGENAHRWCRQTFAIDRVGGEYVRFYEEVLGADHRSLPGSSLSNGAKSGH
jgi:glycosyltransferase involved in cell wall biosynthesis